MIFDTWQSAAPARALARRLAEQLHHVRQQVVIVDLKGDWWGIRSSADGKRSGLPTVIIGGERGDVPLKVHAGEVLAKLVGVEQRERPARPVAAAEDEVAMFMADFLGQLHRPEARDVPDADDAAPRQDRRDQAAEADAGRAAYPTSDEPTPPHAAEREGCRRLACLLRRDGWVVKDKPRPPATSSNYMPKQDGMIDRCFCVGLPLYIERPPGDFLGSGAALVPPFSRRAAWHANALRFRP